MANIHARLISLSEDTHSFKAIETIWPILRRSLWHLKQTNGRRFSFHKIHVWPIDESQCSLWIKNESAAFRPRIFRQCHTTCTLCIPSFSQLIVFGTIPLTDNPTKVFMIERIRVFNSPISTFFDQSTDTTSLQLLTITVLAIITVGTPNNPQNNYTCTTPVLEI